VSDVTDAVVIGSGPNGLVAANLLADAGWSVVVLEAADAPGGAVRSAEVTAPGFVNDLYSAFYPLGAGSCPLQDLRLDEWGLRWTHAPLVVSHPTGDGRAVTLSRDLDVTAASVDSYAPGDGDAWRALYAQCDRIREPLLEALFRPFPPVLPAVRALRTLGTADALRFARFATLPLRRWTQETFNGIGAPSLVAGNALHTDLGPESAGGAIFGWLLCMLGQSVGFPVPVGGAGVLSDALVARLRSRGGQLVCGQPVHQVLVRDGRATGVRTADGTEVTAGRAVLAGVDAPQLFGSMLAPEHLPARLLEDLRRFQWDNGTVKVDWALREPVPWADPDSSMAGTVHLGGDIDALTRYTGQLAVSHVPDEPYLVFGQMTTTDPTRSPAGTESAWAYTHIPQHVRDDAGADGITGKWDQREVDLLVERIERQVERYAPGFRDRVIGRYVAGPLTLEADDHNLYRGALNGGTAAIHQQLFWRPMPGLGRPETPVQQLYLASSSAHPGGGVHGGPGAAAARVALRDAGMLGPVRRATIRAAHRAVYR
jgi:phytoene dehydrogenase-like protein